MKNLAVIFDLDGLILETESLARKAWALAGQDLGLSVPEHVVQAMVGRTIHSIRALLVEMLDADVPHEALLARSDHHYHALIESEAPCIKPGVFELLDFLDGHKIPLALATSSRRHQLEPKTRGTELPKRFHQIVCGDQVENGKPAPDIFLAAAELLGVIPGQCFVLEDSGPGIEAAHAAGMRPLLVPDHQRPEATVAALAYAEFTTLHEVIPFLEILA
ncbi:MAG: HAD superfamily hydrolase (TIGR01509 family) [Kiritimatiellia bacterium]|jgi:HAD superfamily hydrolase (TIGR01509 family)